MASTVKHLRSSTANKRPTASGLAEGQLGINTASGTPGVFFKDSAGTVTKVGPAHVGSTAPNVSPAGSAGNSLGELWVNNSTTINGLNYYTGSAFVNLTPSGTATVAGLVELATDAETQTGTDTIRAVTPSGLQSKISNSTSTTSSTTIASATAVKTAYDLANAALPKSGGRVTGALEIGPAGSLSFEGSSDDGFETTLAVVNPTADRTITFPNVTGNVVTTGDSGTVTSAMIANNTIVDADINASAAIADTKLGTISTAGKVSGTAITSGTIATSGELQITNSFPGIRLTETDGTATHSQTLLARGADQFSISTRSSTGTSLSSDYLIPANASGATDHIWRIANTEKARLDSDGLKIVDDLIISDKITHAGDTNTAIRFPAADTIAFETDGSERARIDSSGRLLVGTSIAAAGYGSIQNFTTTFFSSFDANFSNDASPVVKTLGKSRGALGVYTVVQSGDALGRIQFTGADGTGLIRAAQIQAEVDGTPGSNDMPGRLVFSTTSDGNNAPSERMRITSDGEVRIGNSTGVDITSNSSNGHTFFTDGSVFHARNAGTPLSLGRNTNDGGLIFFYQAGTFEGNISVSGSTVSYNPFLGSHWGRLVDGNKPDILPGTILDTVDQLIEWKQAKFIVDGEEKIAAYNGSAEAGDIVQIVYESTSYSAIVQDEEEEPEELNKHVCVKVNDTVSSKAVFGVFLGWDNDIPDNMVSTWNDLYCAAVGNYFVRIADGETLEIGSLIEANGNGCGIVQEDDIIRSKTVAKITSTIPQKVYDDGSFLVTCVLCCG